MSVLPIATGRLRRRLTNLTGSNAPGPALRRLRVSQDGPRLRVRFTMAPGLVPRVLGAQGPYGWTELAAVTVSGDGYLAEVDLTEVPGAGPAIHIFYLEVEGTEGSERTALAKAAHTELDRFSTVDAGGRSVTVHSIRGGALAVAIDETVRAFGSVRVGLLRIVKGVGHLRGRISTRHEHLTGATFVLRGRTSGHECRVPVTFTLDERYTASHSGSRFYRCTVRIDFAELLEDELFDDDFYDAWMLLESEEYPEPHEIRVGRTPFVTRYLTNPGWAERGGRAAVINPYYTFKAQRTSFQVKVLDADNFRFLRREVRTRHLRRLRNRGRDVWLVGERPNKAQDTGYHFFRHLRTRHPEVDAYYVVEADSPERANVEPLGNVLEYGSKEHIRTTLLANKIASSHHPDFLYPVRTKAFRRAVRGTRVFLQHGVMGTKWMANLYGKGVGTFEADVFVVSSKHEQEYIARDFGFDPDEIAVTGLSRFDGLFAGDVAVRPGQVLVMPTWRDWLGSTTVFRESRYFEEWSELLHDPRLRDIESRHGLEVIFCLHPNMQHFRALFEDVPVRILSQAEVDVQFLLKQSAALITDYSSVGFDFSFLDKPVFYFQFDRNRFLGREGSHLDLDEELPGTIVRTTTEVLDAVDKSAAAGFPMPAENRRRADRFIDHRDRENSERIYQVARGAKRKRDLRGRAAAHPLVAAGWRYLRRNRYYFPAMRLMYKALLHLPADPNMVLFESGLGRQYADSPRYIYEELVRRGQPMTKVWAYNRRLPTMDPHTKVVPRLSPRYFYYLARSRYWVNNQSFPHYVRRRPDGVFVQTWHGTPLKRMLWDLDEVHGRDAGYVQRATDGAAQWSVLVSPSRFATKAISSAFRFSGEVIETGYPRNDVLHAPDRDAHAARIRRRLGLRPEQRVILYAPTFRDDQTDGAGRFTFRLPFDLDRLHATLGDDTVLLLRMHVLIRRAVQIPRHLREYVRNVSTYPEMQELYLASDVLVTDYSSVFFDFAALGRPTVFYAYDIDTYRDTLRGFYLDYESVIPGPMVTTEDELLDVLMDIDKVDAEFAARRAEFVTRFAPNDDARSAARVVDHVFGPTTAEDAG